MTQPSVITAAPAALAPPTKVDHWFYIGVAVLALVLSIAGFGPSIIDTSHRNAPPSVAVVAHGMLMSSWILLFLAQAYLVATGRTALHRRLGVVGAILAGGMIMLGVVLSMATARRGRDFSGDIARAAGGGITPDGVLFPLLSFLDFGILVAAALLFRHRPEIHKRLMTIALLQPMGTEAISHLFGHLAGYWPTLEGQFGFVGGPATLILLSICAIHDRIAFRRIHPVSLWVPAALLVWMNVLIAFVLPSAGWLAFAKRLIE